MRKKLTGIVSEGQPYIDDPVYAQPDSVAHAVANAFRSRRRQKRILLGYERTKLVWVKPKLNADADAPKNQEGGDVL